MARVLRSSLGDGVFHVTARGTGPTLIFLDDDDYHAFLRLLERVRSRQRWALHAYCLLGTHYHLVLEARQRSLSRGMQVLNGEYARHFNERHDRSGALFGGRFRSDPIRDDEHFANACLYVLANPVAAGLCRDVGEWPWSRLGPTVSRH
jgi:REP element-mobilizing transposase RayT